MKKIHILPLALAVALFAACSGSNKSTTTDSSAVTTVKTDSTTLNEVVDTSMSDSTFAMKAAVGGMAEVAMGKMAAGKTKNAQIKDFANMMVMDHGKANDELMGIAKKKNMTLPSGPDAAHQAKMDSLSKLSGTDFDKAYVAAMVDGHQKTLALMNKEAQNGKDADLKGFAAKTAPVVQHHLDKINSIQSSMK